MVNTLCAVVYFPRVFALLKQATGLVCDRLCEE